MADAELEEVCRLPVTGVTRMLTSGNRSGELALRSSSNRVVARVEALPKAEARKNRSEYWIY
jgi:hypothetical protein